MGFVASVLERVLIMGLSGWFTGLRFRAGELWGSGTSNGMFNKFLFSIAIDEPVDGFGEVFRAKA